MGGLLEMLGNSLAKLGIMPAKDRVYALCHLENWIFRFFCGQTYTLPYPFEKESLPVLLT
jgi:hypothetical protein